MVQKRWGKEHLTYKLHRWTDNPFAQPRTTLQSSYGVQFYQLSWQNHIFLMSSFNNIMTSLF